MKAAEFFDAESIIETEKALWPFRSQIADREQVRCALALARQKRIAAANARIQHGFMEGIGEVVASIDADVYYRFGLMYGWDTVKSPDFLRALLRDNPECRVHSVSRKTRIVVPAGYEAPARAQADASAGDVDTTANALEAEDVAHFRETPAE